MTIVTAGKTEEVELDCLTRRRYHKASVKPFSLSEKTGRFGVVWVRTDDA